MAMILTGRDGKETVIDGKTGEILVKNQVPGDLVEVESTVDHQNSQGALCPAGRGGRPGARYSETRVRAMDLVHRGLVKLVETPEVKMAEPEEAEVSSPAKAPHKKDKK